MLSATRQLSDVIQHVLNGATPLSLLRFDALLLVNVIVRFGAGKDARHLYELAQTDADCLDMVMPVLMAHGHQPLADSLYKQYLKNGELNDEAPPSVLHCLGYLGCSEATETLVQYAEADDIFLANNASLGLLSLDCHRFEDRLYKRILSCSKQSDFPELVPALAGKVGDDKLLELLLEWGPSEAQTLSDRQVGMILGIALFGDRGRESFRRLLFDPKWDAASGGGCPEYGILMPLKVQGYTMSKFYDEFKSVIKTAKNDQVIDNAFVVLQTVLNELLRDSPCFIQGVAGWQMDYLALYHLLFECGVADEDESLSSLTPQYSGKDNVIESIRSLQEAFEHKVETQLYQTELHMLR